MKATIPGTHSATVILGREMIIFESTLTTFEASFSFEAAGAVLKIGSSLKLHHHWQINLPKSLKHTVYDEQRHTDIPSLFFFRMWCRLHFSFRISSSGREFFGLRQDQERVERGGSIRTDRTWKFATHRKTKGKAKLWRHTFSSLLWFVWRDLLLFKWPFLALHSNK